MRATIACAALALLACSNAEHAGAEEARRQAAVEQRSAVAQAPAPKRLATPVPGEAKVPCAQLIDLAAFQTALGEKEALEVKDATRQERDATAVCSIVRGGKRLSLAEQEARSKRASRLGVLPGDELCNVTAFCSTIEDPDRFRAACRPSGGADDDATGGHACVTTHGVGADDVKVYRMLDDDTRCVLRVRGGPSNVDNAMIQRCARTARETIGLAQIKVAAPGTTGPPGPP